MAINQRPVSIKDFTGGQQSFTSPFLSRNTETPGPSINYQVDRPGFLERGPGFTRLGTSGSGACKGLAMFDQEDGTHTLVRLHTTTLQKWNGSSWSNIVTSFTNNSTDIMYGATTYTDDDERLYIVTGHNDDLLYWDGSSTGIVSGYKGKHVAFYKGRIYLLNTKVSSTTKPSRFIWSGIGDDVFDSNNFSDDFGEPIIGTKVFGGYLYIFGQNKIATWDFVNLNFLESDTGTSSGRSIAVSNGALFWHSPHGFYMYTGVGRPSIISRAVSDYVSAIQSTTMVSAGIDSEQKVCFWIGDVTVNGISYVDVVLRYDPLMDNWDIQTGLPMNVMITGVSAGVYTLYGADSYTSEIDDGDTRDAASFDFQYTLPWIIPEDDEHETNWYKLRIVTAKVDNGDTQQVTIKYRMNNETNFTTVGTTFTTSETEEISYFDVPLLDSNGYAPRGHMLQPQLSIGDSAPLKIIAIHVFYGVEVRKQ